jgi:hypothetical protein
MSNKLFSINCISNFEKKADKKCYLTFIYSLFFILLVLPCELVSQGRASSAFISADTSKTILIKPNEPEPLKRLTGDTFDLKIPSRTEETAKPGQYSKRYTPAQDSAYYKAIKQRLPINTRFQNDIKMLTYKYNSSSRENDPWENARNNMNIPHEFLLPSDVERASYQYGIQMSQYVPFMKTIPQFGMTVSLSTIGKLLGMEEDVSPVIKYELEYTSDVEVVVYSMQAVVIATIIKGIQPAGFYTYTWNGRNDVGLVMPHGDYVAEVRIGKSKFIRKRIVIY